MCSLKKEKEIGEKKERGKESNRCVCFYNTADLEYVSTYTTVLETVTKGILTRTLGLEKCQAATRSATMRNASSFVASLRVASTTICLWIMQDRSFDSSFRVNVSFRAFLKRNVLHPAWVKSSFQRSAAIYESHHRLIIFVPLVFCKVDSVETSFISSRRMASIDHVKYRSLLSSKGRIGISLDFSSAERDEVQHLFSPECKFMITFLLYDKSALLLRMHLVSEESCQGHNWSIMPCVDERLSLGLIFEAH